MYRTSSVENRGGERLEKEIKRGRGERKMVEESEREGESAREKAREREHK